MAGGAADVTRNGGAHGIAGDGQGVSRA
jgi:hypothetical protein